MRELPRQGVEMNDTRQCLERCKSEGGFRGWQGIWKQHALPFHLTGPDVRYDNSPARFFIQEPPVSVPRETSNEAAAAMV